MSPTAENDRLSEQSAAEFANEPQWIVWTDLAGEADWVAAELAVFGAHFGSQ